MASPRCTPGGVKASGSETLKQRSGCLQVQRGGDWVGATFGDPRTPEKAQRRLGGLPIKKKKKKMVYSNYGNSNCIGKNRNPDNGLLPRANKTKKLVSSYPGVCN